MSEYAEALEGLRRTHGDTRAMELIVGGDYVAQGVLEKSLLMQLGTPRSGRIVDVGCGSGRLAFALHEYLSGEYVGTDILAAALAYAEMKVQRPDWRFVKTEDTRLPVADSWADVVCFFSVFTHLHDEDCFRYLEEARRIVKPSGLIVFSYLDFEVSWHWPIFDRSLKARDHVLNRFHAKSALRVWGEMLALDFVRFVDGSEPWVELQEPVTFDDGRSCSGVVEFGQSVAVFRALAGEPEAPRIEDVVTKLGLKHRVA